MALPSHKLAYVTAITLTDGVDTIYFDGTKGDDRMSELTFTPGDPNMAVLSKLGQSGNSHVNLGGRSSRTVDFVACLDNWTGVTDNAQSRVDKLKLWKEAGTVLTFTCDFFHALVGYDAHADTLTCIITKALMKEEQGSQPHRYIMDLTLEEDV